MGSYNNYAYTCKNGFLAGFTDENGLTVKDACCACGGGGGKTEEAEPELECTNDPPDWAAESFSVDYQYKYDCSVFKSQLTADYFYGYVCKDGYYAGLTDEDGLDVKDACCVCGGGNTEEPEQESNWFITYVGSLLSDNTLTSTYNTKSGVGSVPRASLMARARP